MFIPFKQKSCRMQKEGNQQRKINVREIKTQEHKNKRRKISNFISGESRSGDQV